MGSPFGSLRRDEPHLSFHDLHGARHRVGSFGRGRVVTMITRIMLFQLHRRRARPTALAAAPGTSRAPHTARLFLQLICAQVEEGPWLPKHIQNRTDLRLLWKSL